MRRQYGRSWTENGGAFGQRFFMPAATWKARRFSVRTASGIFVAAAQMNCLAIQTMRNTQPAIAIATATR